MKIIRSLSCAVFCLTIFGQANAMNNKATGTFIRNGRQVSKQSTTIKNNTCSQRFAFLLATGAFAGCCAFSAKNYFDDQENLEAIEQEKAQEKEKFKRLKYERWKLDLDRQLEYLNEPASEERSIFLYAVYNGQSYKVQALLMDPKIMPYSKNTLRHAALFARHNYPSVYRVLLEYPGVKELVADYYAVPVEDILEEIRPYNSPVKKTDMEELISSMECLWE